MDFNPHSLHQILLRIRDQMRCPQCGTRVQVDFPSIKIAGDDFMLLQLKCESCSAFIVLHVNLTDKTASKLADNVIVEDGRKNASSQLTLDESEMATLQNALTAYDGSFEKMFKELPPPADAAPSAPKLLGGDGPSMIA
ncbi:MAG TPA: hypothetical protein PKV72_01245 [Candidatus Peribacteria bacterium]|nr:hypothetical protein [Candidatus Peribacteria bacterium]